MDARVKLFPLILTKQSPQQPYALFKRCVACFAQWHVWKHVRASMRASFHVCGKERKTDLLTRGSSKTSPHQHASHQAQ